MAETRRMSPYALSMRKRGLLISGIGMLVVWAAITIPVTLAYSNDPLSRVGMVLALQFFVGILGLLGVVFTIIGIAREGAARRFNRRDWAMADALHDALSELCNEPPRVAYRPVESDTTISGGRLVEIERHFDAQTEGAITGSISHQLRMFGASFSSSYGTARATGPQTSSMSSSSLGFFGGSIRGLSTVNLTISQTTRDNLMGDALFAVFEAPGPGGQRDTYRVISMSQPGVIGWLQDLMGYAAGQLGGTATHAGGTVASWVGNLVERFAPGDVSYTVDRLKAIQGRPPEEHDPIAVYGTPTGRNAVIATAVTIGPTQLRLMPARFPELFGHQLAVALAQGEQHLTSRGRPQPVLAR